jgi:Cys-tRNA(Pro)/Cys-tRNA(Cys) deacylase
MNGDAMNTGKKTTVFDRLTDRVARSGVPHVLHSHAATRTMEEAAQNLTFDVRRIVKTVAFRTRSGKLVLAALRGLSRVDYPRLAALVGVNRRDLSPLSPEEVQKLIGVEAGSVSPLPFRNDMLLLMDDDVLTILPTIYCGIGRPDRTLELAPADLLRLAGGRTGWFSQ